MQVRALPVSHSLPRLTSVCILARETLNAKVFKSLTLAQRMNLSNNSKYVKDIIGTPSTGSSCLQQQNLCPTNEEPYFQKQGSSALCGLCALNNLLGGKEFVSGDLDRISDNIWFQQINNGLSLVDEIQFNSLQLTNSKQH